MARPLRSSVSRKSKVVCRFIQNLADCQQPWLMKEERSVEIAGCAQLADARLVWKPSRATRSAFYPLWEVSIASGSVWLDHGKDIGGAYPGGSVGNIKVTSWSFRYTWQSQISLSALP
jgi:hypothetical protein